jgi:hypothetical protein
MKRSGGDQLLRKQVAKPARGLDRPRPLLERLSPRQQLHHLPARGAHFHHSELALVVANRDRRVRRLVRIDTNDHCHDYLRGLV